MGYSLDYSLRSRSSVSREEMYLRLTWTSPNSLMLLGVKPSFLFVLVLYCRPWKWGYQNSAQCFPSYCPQVFDACLPLFAIKAVHVIEMVPPLRCNYGWFLRFSLTGLCGRRASAVALRPEARELRSPHALNVAQHLGRWNRMVANEVHVDQPVLDMKSSWFKYVQIKWPCFAA
jgi:hypothetical protein